MVRMDGTVAQRLGEHIVGLEYTAIPASAVNRMKDVVLDQFGCQLLSSSFSCNKLVADYVGGLGERPESTIVNYGTRALVHDVAFVNGTFGQGSELDDNIEGGGSRTGSSTVPVGIAVAESLHADGEQLITALVAGFDVAWLVNRAMMPHVLMKGFGGQMIIGIMAGTAVAGKLLGLDGPQLANAIAIAGSHGSGTMEYDQSGGDVKRLRTGIVAREAIQAAVLAKMGMTGPLTIFEGKRGVLPIFGGGNNPEVILDNIGRDFGVHYAAFKVYPTVTTLHTSIDALSELMVEHGIVADRVTRVDVGINEITMLHGATIYDPHDSISAQFSLPFSLAIRLLTGDNDLSSYLDPAMWHNEAVLNVARRVHPYVHPDIPTRGIGRYAARMKVTVAGGQEFEKSVAYPRGSLTRPLSADDLRRKFERLAASVLPRERVAMVVEEVGRLESVRDTADLVSLLVQEAPEGSRWDC